MVGVPFDSIERLRTPGSVELARKVIASRAERAIAKAEVETFFQSRQRLLSPAAYHALRLAARADRPPGHVEGVQPAFFTNYSTAATKVEMAERELDSMLLREVNLARATLLESSRQYLESYLVFAADSARDLLGEQTGGSLSGQRELPPRNNAARKIEQSLLLYLQRVAAKNDTFSEFGPTGWGRAGSEKGLTLAPRPGVAGRDAYFERWTAHAVAAAMNADPQIFLELSPRLNPNGRIEGEMFIAIDTGEKIVLDKEQIAVIERCDGKIPVDSLGVPVASIRSLVEQKVLRCAVEVPALEPHPLAVLYDDVQKWREGEAREKWLGILKPLMELRQKFAKTSQAHDRTQTLGQARSRLKDIGAIHRGGDRFLYAATNPIGEDCVRDCNFQISESSINEVAAQAELWIDLWRDSYAFIASRVAAGLRGIMEKIGPGNAAIPLPAFLHACDSAKLSLTGPGLVALAAIAFQEVKAAFRERLRPHLDADEYELTQDDCHVVRQRFDYPKFDEYTYPSADLQLSAKSIEAFGRGEYQWIISELHPPAAMLHHGYYWACPDKPTLNRYFAATIGGKPNFHFGFFAADFTSHTTIRAFDALPEFSNFVAAQRAHPDWRQIRPAETEVFIDNQGDVVLRKADSREYLGSFARAWLIPLGFHPFQFGVPPQTPRLRCGNIVVQRRTWTVSQDELPAGNYTGISRDLTIAIEQLRIQKNWPRCIYIRPTEQALRRSGAVGRDKDTKPVFIDLENYLFLEIFHRWLIKSGELEVTEMLPDADHLLWREPDGRRTFELRTLIVPRK